MAVAEHLTDLEQLLTEVPPCEREGVIQFRLDHPTDGRTFFSVLLGREGHRLEAGPRVHPQNQLAVSGPFDDWLKLFKSPHAQKFGELRLWGAVDLLVQMLAPRTKRRSFVDIRAGKGEW